MKSNEKNFIKDYSGKRRRVRIRCRYILTTHKGITHKVLLPIQNDGLIEECINDIFLSIWNNANKFHGEPSDFKSGLQRLRSLKQLIITGNRLKQ